MVDEVEHRVKYVTAERITGGHVLAAYGLSR
jgi:hypothetical protein